MPQLRANLARSDIGFGAGPNKQIFAENCNCGHSWPAWRLAEACKTRIYSVVPKGQ